MIKQKINNFFILFLYRLIKILCFRLLYDTFVYKLFRSHKISNIIDSTKKYRLVVCHNGGGGTISYMKNKYFDLPDVLVLRNAVTADKDYLYSLENIEIQKKVYIKPGQLKQVNSIINEINIVAVESYMSLAFILPWFASLGVPITYDIHDYHCIWYETHFIHKGRYLTKDELEKSVLKYGRTKISFQQWHQFWVDFFPNVQLINAFSTSSKQIFTEYYPEFADKVVVTPHSLDYIKCGKLHALPEEFTIGIFGIIRGADKGCNVVRSFLEYSKNKNYQIFLNGELNSDYKIEAQNIHYYGRYDVNNLDKVIEDQGISCVLFPSICPETFSYTVSELIHVGVPVACFNFGAQAEKVGQYEMGQIIKDFSNEEILIALKAVHQKGVEYYAKKNAEA